LSILGPDMHKVVICGRTDHGFWDLVKHRRLTQPVARHGAVIRSRYERPPTAADCLPKPHKRSSGSLLIVRIGRGVGGGRGRGGGH